MGAGIAEVAAKAGYRGRAPLTHSRRAADATLAGLDTVAHQAGRQGQARRGRAGRPSSRASPATADLDDLADCDLVIESVVEDLAVKKALFAELDAVVQAERHPRHEHVDAAGHRAGDADPRPERVCGIHFFNPAPVMSLVEVVRPLTATDETIAAAKAFAAACGKDAVEVKDRAGFIVNALLFPYLNNAVRMLEHGTASMATTSTPP